MPLIAIITGPTASGKTALALRWAAARGLEIISADSRQAYRGFRIGTGQPTAAERAAVPHHLVDHLDPRESGSPRRFAQEADAIVAARPGTGFLVVGGTGLYLREWMHPGTEERAEIPREIREAVAARIAAEGLEAIHAELVALDPGGMRRVEPTDTYRITKRLEHWLHTGRTYARREPDPPLNPLFAGVPFLWLHPDRKELHGRIAARVEAMFDAGWVDEVRELAGLHDVKRTPAFNAIGYREIADALAAGKDPRAAIPGIVARTRQYAKKQVTFFRHQFPGAQAHEPAALLRALEARDFDPAGIPQAGH